MEMQFVNIENLDCCQSIIKTMSKYYNLPFSVVYYESLAFKYEEKNINYNKSVFYMPKQSEEKMFDQIYKFCGLKRNFIASINSIMGCEFKHTLPLLVEMKAKYIDWCQGIAGNRKHLFLITYMGNNTIKIMDPFYLKKYIYHSKHFLYDADSISYFTLEEPALTMFDKKMFFKSNISNFNSQKSVVAMQNFVKNIDMLLEKQCYLYGDEIRRSPLLKSLNYIYGQIYNTILTSQELRLKRSQDMQDVMQLIGIMNKQLKKWESLRLLIMRNCIIKQTESDRIKECFNDLLSLNFQLSKFEFKE